jgi:hypothetical protein
VNELRFTNPSLPQTLQIAVVLFYVRAVLWLLSLTPLFLLIGIAGGLAGLGIASEKRWGYILGVVIAAVPLAVTVIGLVTFGIPSGNDFLFFLLSIAFDVALFAALVHPQSREYQRIWFK